MKYLGLFSGKNKKNIISLSSVEYAQRVVMYKKVEMGIRSGLSLVPI